MQEIIIVAHAATDSVNEGFLPAAKRLGLSVVLLTDCSQAHREQFARSAQTACPDEIIACDVFNPLALIDLITRRKKLPAAIFSNSDHLQGSTAIAAHYFGLPGKDWLAAYRAKNKAEMRACLASLGIDALWHAVVCDMHALAGIEPGIPFPCVVKPREGVASQQVSLAADIKELQTRCAAIWADHPGQPLLIEEYIAGPLYTLETLGDSKDIVVLGGFRTTLSPLPHFIELDAIWGTGLPQESEHQVLDIIRRLGVGFGACHTEFVMTDSGPRLIEINYRSIGDYREFLLCDTLQIPLFEIILRLHLGEQLPQLEIPAAAACIRYFNAHSEGRLQRAPEAFAVVDEHFHLTFKPLRRIGDTIQLTHSNKDYLGVLRGAAACPERLAAAVAKASHQLVWEIAP